MVDDGYRRAREILHSRFGSTYCIVDTWIQRITDGPLVKDKDMLRDFADCLRNCCDCLSSMGYIGEINTQRVLVKVVERLPQYLRSRWLRHVQQYRRALRSEPSIADLMEFVEGYLRAEK